MAISQKSDGSMKLSKNKFEKKEILKNRKKFLKKFDIQLTSLVSAGLIQGNKIGIVSKKDSGKIIQGKDGLLTKERGLYLGITIADCLPIFIFDKEKEIIGILHAGWRGLAKEIVSLTIKKMKRAFGSESKNILVGIGPGICKRHYAVKKEIFSHFQPFSKGFESKKGRYFLDLKKIAKIQLLKEGLNPKKIEISPQCTYFLKNKYFSFRREKPKEIKAMLAIIGKSE